MITASAYGRALSALCLLYIGGILVAQLSTIVDPSYLHEEQRALFTFHQASDPALFAGDYLAGVVGALPQPYLYEGGTRLWLWAGGDLLLLHRLLPLACWLAFLGGMAVAARSLGDRITMLGAVGVTIAQPVYLYQITPASPHAFAFPLLIWGIVALLKNSVRGSVLVTLLSAVLYTAMTPVLGLLLAWQVFIQRAFLRLAGPERLKLLLLLAVTGGLSLWLVFLSLRGPEELGPSLAPMQQVDLYPENGPQGRHFYGVFNPMLYVVSKAIGQFRTADVMLALPVLLAYCLFAIYGFSRLPRGSAARGSLIGFVLCSLATGLLIYLLKPYHSYRFLLYPLLTVLPLLAVFGAQHFLRQHAPFARFSAPLTVALLGLLVLSLDSLDTKKAGYRWHLAPEEQQVMAFAAGQQPQTLFATWPGVASPLEFIPYMARRPIFVLSKAHYADYPKHILEMRARMDSLIDAYLATDEAPLAELGCRWGVDYLIVEKAHFAPGNERPRYFAPFDARIDELWQAHRREDFLLGHPDPAWVALENARYAVLRLPPAARQDAGACGSGEDAIEAAGAGL